MSEQHANPVELFGMRVAHVGINATDPADALEIAELTRVMYQPHIEQHSRISTTEVIVIVAE